MPDWAMSGRRDAYRFVTADPFTLSDVGQIEMIPSECSITYGYYTDNYATARLTAPDSYDGGLIRIYHNVTLPDGTDEEECLGTFFVDSVERNATAGMVRQSMDCYSTLWRLSQDALAEDYVVARNTVCLNGLGGLITAEGARAMVYPGVDAEKTHTIDFRIATGENRLDAVNAYAGWCGWTVGVDDYGYQTIEVYTPPANRSPSYTFEAGANCVYVPDSSETFTGDVCNRVVARWSREKAPDGFNGVTSMRSVADLPKGNPYSFEACGRRITHVLDVDPCSQAELNAKAQQYLAQHDAAIRYFEIEHVGIPYLRPGMTVTYIDERNEDALLCEVTQMDIGTLGPLCMTKTKLKVVDA